MIRRLITYFQNVFHIDFGTLDEENKKIVLDQFTDECMNRVNVITAIAFIGESILMFM